MLLEAISSLVAEIRYWLLMTYRIVRHGGDNCDHFCWDDEQSRSLETRSIMARDVNRVPELNRRICFIGFSLTAAAIIAAALGVVEVATPLGIIGAYLDWRTYRTRARLG